ncbi:hypothetical protein ACFW3C_05335 [Streptomyces sp. NPDC058871]|uniref:hypothetical protein n=1 Tax=unclassified Streptomyces TaxID=2593676 RepID=UPI00369EDF06
MSSAPIPELIAEGALALANDRQAKSEEASADPESVVARISAAAEAAGLKDELDSDGKLRASKEKQYIDLLAEDAAKLTPAEGTKPISVFWSFGLEHPEAPLNDWDVPFLSQRFIAEEWAAQQNKANPGSAQTLETTRGGAELDDMFLWEPEVIEALGGAESGFHPGYAKEVWGKISKTYAGLAEGRVIVFGQDANTRSILHTQESGELCRNAEVGLHNIHFAYEANQSWPEVTRNEAGTNEVRAVAQFDNPTLPRYIDPEGFAKLTPEERQAKIDGIIEEVAPGQGSAGAVEAPERQASPKALPTPLWQLGFKQPTKTTRAVTPVPASAAGPKAGPILDTRPQAAGMDGLA